MISKPEAGVLYQTFVEADRLRVKAFADGVDREAADDLVARALEQAWPKGRELPWRYLCDVCGDTGWRRLTCAGDATCGRVNRHLGHDYVQPCWCQKGRALIVKPPSDEDVVEKAAKVRKAPSRFGR